MYPVLRQTKSLCPECLQRIDASLIEKHGCVYMTKTCPEHGDFEVLIWEDSGEKYLEWIRFGGTALDENGNTHVRPVEKGCPYDCGICNAHARNISTAALMTSNVCDVNCPICFTKDKNQGRYMPSNEELLRIAESYKTTYSAEHLIELCGGEPTVRDDLPALAAGLKRMGFEHIQLNTNGIRIAREPEFLAKLKENGVSVVYLGFDGISEEIYLRKYNRNLLESKLQAIQHCEELQIAVVLVPVVINGVNESELGDIIRIAREYMPTVKGVYFQPLSYFGQYPETPSDEKRITIPRIIRLLEEQTQGEISRTHFLPGGSEHPLCSFGAFYMADRNNALKPISRLKPRGITQESAKKTIAFNKKAWRWSKNRTLTVGGMHFQDVWNLDLERLRQCRVCILNEDRRIIPLCAKYITSTRGEKLYNGIS